MHDLFRKKYQEMMEHVEVSEEMRERIMETLEQEAAQAGAGEKTAKTEKTRVGAKKAPSKASPAPFKITSSVRPLLITSRILCDPASGANVRLLLRIS